MTSQVHNSPAAAARILGRVQPRICLRNRNVCSMSNLPQNAKNNPARSRSSTSGTEDHNHNGLGDRSPGRRSTLTRTTVPAMTG